MAGIMDYFTGNDQELANQKIMEAYNNGVGADTIARMGARYTDQGAYNNISNDLGLGGGAPGGLGDWFGKQSGGDLAGLAGMGLQGYSALFGQGRDIGKEQLGLLRDQRAANQQSLADRKQFNTGLAQASKNVFGGGLASQGA